MLFEVQFYSGTDGAQPIVDFLEVLRTTSPELHKLLLAGLVRLVDSRRHDPPLIEMVDAKHDILELRAGDANIA